MNSLWSCNIIYINTHTETSYVVRIFYQYFLIPIKIWVDKFFFDFFYSVFIDSYPTNWISQWSCCMTLWNSIYIYKNENSYTYLMLLSKSIDCYQQKFDLQMLNFFQNEWLLVNFNIPSCSAHYIFFDFYTQKYYQWFIALISIFSW